VKPGAAAGIQAGMSHHPKLNAVSWVLQLAVAAILLQTLFFKFTGAEESVYIFTTLGVEPWGRIASGVFELAAAGLLLVPATAPFGALLTMGLMAGAIGSHLTVLGIEVKGDGGLLFGLALTAFAGSAVVLLIRRAQLPILARLLEVS
jgi:putative oxidoreductase